MDTQSPFHPGEIEVQKFARESHIAQRNGGIISGTISAGAIAFIAQQNMLLISSIDSQENIWTSVLVGQAGFIRAQNSSSLLLDTTNIIKQPNDPLWHNIIVNAQVGLLVIELDTRRRFRINGRIQRISQTTFSIEVEQAYPNCPKYIQRRSLKISNAAITQKPKKPNKGAILTDQQIKLISNADSLFVGSANPITNQQNCKSWKVQIKYGGDVSYRGGYPGFVDVFDACQLRIPDYRGNSMFNTLGNIQTYPKAGVVFIVFERGRLLQVSGEAKILWDLDDPTNKTNGSMRFWQLDIASWQETELPSGLDWHFFDYSPHNPRVKNKIFDGIGLKNTSY